MADTQYSSPLKIGVDAKAETLTRISISSGENRFNEAFIQDLVFENPCSLPIDQIDRSFSHLIPVCKELSTQAGRLDVLYVTPEGRLVILEAKLWRNPEARRKVVAQILDYAKDLRRWDYEDLQREVSKATGEKGNVLYRLVSNRTNLSEAEFVDEVNRSLASGRFLLLIVGDGIREGAAAIADFLTDVGNMEFTFGLVEVAVYESKAKELIIQPRVLAKTVIIQRTVVSLKDGRLEIDDTDNENDDITPPEKQEWKDYEIYYSQFWPEFISELELDDPSQPMPSGNLEGRRHGNIFFPMPPGGNQAWITVYFWQKHQQIGAFLTFRKGEFADIAYKELLKNQKDINSELGIEVGWESKNGKNTIGTYCLYDDIFAEENREDIKLFLSDTVNRFVNVFRPRLERIVEDI